MNPWMIETLHYRDAEINAGAIACAHDYLAVGTYSGYALFHYPSLALVASSPNFYPKHCSCTGVQITPHHLVVLGHRVVQSFEHPSDWAFSLTVLSLPSLELAADIPLGPGNWSLVKGMSAANVVVYDTTEDQGVRCFDTLTCTERWSFQKVSFQRLSYARTDLLIGITSDSDVICLDRQRGQILIQSALPLSTAVKWTALLHDGTRLILGGYTLLTKDYILGRWDPYSDTLMQITHSPLGDHFSPSVIEYAFADEDDCGADIHHISNIGCLANPHLSIITFGGHGERLGACQSACSIATLDLDTLALSASHVLDDSDGASGFLVAPDGAAIIDCCGTVRVVRYKTEL